MNALCQSRDGDKVPYRLCPQVVSKLVGKVNKTKHCAVWKILDPDTVSDQGIQRKASDSTRVRSWKDGDWLRTLSLSFGLLGRASGSGEMAEQQSRLFKKLLPFGHLNFFC